LNRLHFTTDAVMKLRLALSIFRPGVSNRDFDFNRNFTEKSFLCKNHDRRKASPGIEQGHQNQREKIYEKMNHNGCNQAFSPDIDKS